MDCKVTACYLAAPSRPGWIPREAETGQPCRRPAAAAEAAGADPTAPGPPCGQRPRTRAIHANPHCQGYISTKPIVVPHIPHCQPYISPNNSLLLPNFSLRTAILHPHPIFLRENQSLSPLRLYFPRSFWHFRHQYCETARFRGHFGYPIVHDLHVPHHGKNSSCSASRAGVDTPCSHLGEHNGSISCDPHPEAPV